MTVSESPVLELQQAVYELLSESPTLAGVGVYDEPPEDAQSPYIRIGDVLSTPDNVHGSFGRQVAFTIQIWTRARSNLPGQKIAEKVGRLLDHQVDALAMSGHRVVSIRNEFDQALRDPDPGVRRHVLRFRIRTEQLQEE